jgi:UDP-N-acetylglucosamine:LPS N-acetylglucosamine transferase
MASQRTVGAMRVLIFTADIGEGHDLPARALRDAIVADRPDVEVTILDALDSAGPGARLLVRRGAEFLLARLPWLFNVQYWLVARFPPTRALSRRLACALGQRGLLREVTARRPDVIVTTYPGANDVLCDARGRGRLAVPVVSAITDLAALNFWAHPHCDLHLVIHPESAAEIRSVAGPGARVEAVRGLTSAEFDHPVDPAGARTRLGLPADAPVIVVSGGGWGVGDLRGAVAAALGTGSRAQVLALCGRSAGAQRLLQRTFADEPRVRVMGFTERMSDVLGAADVLVHSTAGLTVFEALIRGARVISYGWGVGHLRLNNRAYRRFGLADVVVSRAELENAIRRALASPRRPDLAYGDRPAAADAVLALVERATGVLETADRARGGEHAASG